jgi:hypothetical protein
LRGLRLVQPDQAPRTVLVPAPFETSEANRATKEVESYSNPLETGAPII